MPIASTEGYNNTTKEGDWWNPTIKTIYDPCPNGYRIPENGTYGDKWSYIPSSIGWDWSSSGLSSGMTWKSKSSFFPASGNRNSSSGQFGDVGTYGASLLSTSHSSVYGSFLGFFSNYLEPNNKYHRSQGYPTRCIKEQ